MTEKKAAKTVFIIDDDASVRRSLARLLITEDYLVEEFASGAEFLDRSGYSGKGCILLCSHGLAGQITNKV